MGASGFVGSHVTRKLAERGDDVRVYLRKSSSTVAIDDLDVERCYGDLRDEEALRAAMSDRDVVYYCIVDTRFYLRDPGPLYETNVESLRRVLDLASKANLHRSSSAAPSAPSRWVKIALRPRMTRSTGTASAAPISSPAARQRTWCFDMHESGD
jgi:nucleoside-diphosphate-sugar epimerase